MLDNITPVLLTFNEECNIGRTLSCLRWAKDVIVVDSGSTDETLTLLAKFSNVRVFIRHFDTHANQWRFATEETKITTDWLLRLDADYQLSDALIAELAELRDNETVNAYRLGFDYAVFSRTLLSSLYPPNTVLLRRGCFSVRDKGHTETWEVRGGVATLRSRIVHDDWKSTERWLVSQVRYMRRELEWLPAERPGLARWMRLRPPLMPVAAFLYCLFGKGLIFNGRAGVYYALQRLVAEGILALLLLEGNLRDRTRDARRENTKAE